MTILKNPHHFVDLLMEMTGKEFYTRYKYTLLGFFWLIVNPLLQMIIIGFVFQFFVKEVIPHYYFHLFIGLLVWNFFSLSLSKTTPCIVFERYLIKKAVFPREVIPLSIILSNLIHFILGLFLTCVPIFFLGTFAPQRIFLLILSLALLVGFTSGLSLLTAALNVRFRDVNFFVQALLILWFYATPIVYSLNSIPPETRWLWSFNPLAVIVQLFQYSFLGSPIFALVPLIEAIFFTFLMIIIGATVFQKESKNFDDWI